MATMLGNNHFKSLVASGELEGTLDIVKDFDKEYQKEKSKRKHKRSYYDDDEDEDNRKSWKSRGDDDSEDDGDKKKGKKSKGDEGVENGTAGKASEKSKKLQYGPGQEIEENQGYRDRAAERRQGYNPDYDDDIEKMVQMDVEKSKYLGGDVKHTHLVRGLDYALLNKVRQETLEQQQQQLEATLEAQKKSKVQGAAGAAKKKAAAPQTEEELAAAVARMRTRTPLGRGVQLYFAQRSLRAPVQFGQLSFEFDLDPASAQEVPTTVSKAKADAEAEDDTLETAALDDALAQAVEQAFVGIRQGLKAGKRRRKKGRGQPAPEKGKKPAVVDAVGDIFEDAGKDYRPAAAGAGDGEDAPLEKGEVREERRGRGGGGGGGSGGGYFSNLSARTREEEEAERAAKKKSMEIPSMSSKAIKDMARKVDKEEKKKIVHRDPLAKAQQARGVALDAAGGAYDDIFPTTGDFETYDSDEDLSKMDPGTTKWKKDLKPWDFDNDEDWEKHKRQREMLPKAAFQFGVKMDDGRKTRRGAGGGGGGGKGGGKRGDKDKLDYEMNEINKIWKSKAR